MHLEFCGFTLAVEPFFELHIRAKMWKYVSTGYFSRWWTKVLADFCFWHRSSLVNLDGLTFFTKASTLPVSTCAKKGVYCVLSCLRDLISFLSYRYFQMPYSCYLGAIKCIEIWRRRNVDDCYFEQILDINLISILICQEAIWRLWGIETFCWVHNTLN